MPRTLLFLILSLLASACSNHNTPPATAVASAHPTATRAGEAVLAQGGNAFDAAVAVAATLAVVEPYSSGLGGGGFWLLHTADGKDIMLDGREKAPLAATRDMYLDEQGEVVHQRSMDGPLAAGIPGVPAALVRLARDYGKLSLQQDLAPAIEAAREGFLVTEHYRRMAAFRLEALRASPAAAAVFLHNNDVPPLGQVIRQPDLAATLEALAGQGVEGFYSGKVGQALVRGARAAGGIWTVEDLERYRTVEREPIVGQYGDYRIISAAPPSSGGIALVEMLHILEHYPLETLDGAHRKHLIVEAMRRAYRDRAEYLGDPDFVQVPVEKLTGKDYAAELAVAIDPEEATLSSTLRPVAVQPEGPHTTHYSILDKQGNRVSATLSINYPFGSAFVAPGTGVLLNDEMDDFSAKPGVPNAYGLVGAEANAIAPGKRPLSSMSPTFVEGPNGVAILGTPGGSRIITMVLLGILDDVAGQSPQHWVGLRRFHHQYLPDVIQYEAGALTVQEQQQLQLMGHVIRQVDDYGNMQAILWDKKNDKVMAASDPRVEGMAEVK